MSIEERRVRLVLAQIKKARGYGWQSYVARETGLHQTFIGRLERGERGAGLDVIDRMVKGLGIRREYFTNEALGAEPKFTEYLRTSPVDRSEVRSPYPAFEALILHLRERDAITPYQVSELRKVRYTAGDEKATPEAARDELAAIQRQQLGEALTAATAPSRIEQLEAEGKKKRTRRART